MGEIRAKNLLCRRGSFTLDIEELTINTGEKIALLGENGCGKTTLLFILAGLLPHKGELIYEGARWDELTAAKRSEYMSFLPQEADVLFNLTVEELSTLTLSGVKLNGEEREAILEATEMTAFLPRIYHSLSGGEKRRAMLARVLLQARNFLFLDEPTAPLDLRHSARLMNYIASTKSCIVAAMHDLNLAVKHFDRFLLMKNGKILFDKGKHELDTESLEEIYSIKFKRLDNYFIPEH